MHGNNGKQLASIVVAVLSLLAGCVSGAAPEGGGESQGPYRLKWVLEAPGSVGSLAWSPDGSLLATAGLGNDGLLLWDMKGGRLARKVKTPFNPSDVYGFSPDGRQVMVSRLAKMSNGRPYAFSILNATTDEIFAHVKGHYDGPADLAAFSPKGDVAVAIFGHPEKDRIAVFDTATWQVVHSFARGQSLMAKLAMSPDNTHVAVARYGGFVQVWNYRTGEMVREWKAHPQNLDSLRFSSNGKLLITISGDIVTHDSTGKMIARREGEKLRAWSSNTWEIAWACFPEVILGKSLPSMFVDGSRGIAISIAERGTARIFANTSCDTIQEFSENVAFWTTPVAISDGGRFFAAGGRPSKTATTTRVVIWERVDQLKSGGSNQGTQYPFPRLANRD